MNAWSETSNEHGDFSFFKLFHRNPDPVLEKLRSEVDGPPNLDTLALNSQRLTANVHAAYLFEMEGLPTLRQLCLLLSATASGKLYSGWQEFAARLGLSLEQIQVGFRKNQNFYEFMMIFFFLFAVHRVRFQRIAGSYVLRTTSLRAVR